MALPRTVLRPLGGYEMYSSSRHSLGLYENVITVCRYTLPAGQSETQVKASIRQAVTTHFLEKLPALRVGISGEETKKPEFVSLPLLDLNDHLEWVSRTPGLASDEYDAQLMRELERENARPWLDVETHSPWRVVVYLNTTDGWADVAFALHHALGDGKSGLIYHGLLVDELNSQTVSVEVDEKEGSTVFEFTEQPELVPSQETLVKFTFGWTYLVGTLWKEMGPAWLTGAPKHEAYTGPRVSLEPKLKGYLRIFHLAPEHAAALLAGCREHKITLTALVHGLLMVLFARRFPADVAKAFSCSMPISMRPYIQKPAGMTLDVNRNMANLVSAHSFSYQEDSIADGRDVASTAAEDDEKVWRAAALLSTSLKERLANVTENNILGLMGWINDWHGWWTRHEGKVRDGTWAVSNTGSIPATGEVPVGAPAPQWKRTRNFYTQSSLGKDSLINVNVGGVRGGEMSFIVAWHHGVVKEEFADKFANDLHACLENYGKTGHFSVPNRLSE
ncbi:hypothetical protein SEUCBS140593_008654 [Sporothrix eucalyptigena]|uniref:Alcohol acetyltransferase n=1 Tax=Sporothrix eucalyptigena TaxID=1812306 RepID=A0ABP0CND1_9PEZI